jgi:4-hydroxy-3-methylbut-2-enyl diphosphate reductase
MTGDGRGLLVLAPLSIEARAVRSGLPRARVVTVGMGPRRAERGAAAASKNNGSTRAVAVAGFCGALDTSLHPGEVVVASEIRGPGGPRALPSSGMLMAALSRLGVPARMGPILSVDHLVMRRDERHELAQTGAIAVDMESAWLASAANGHPLAVMRVVSDSPGRDLIAHPLATAVGGVRAYRALARAVPALETWAKATGSRRVLLAGPRSFCAGVDRAIEIVERALDRYGPPIYVRKQIVHNVHVVRDL